MKNCEGLFHPLLEIGMEDICKLTGVDIHSKKLKLIEQVKILASYVVLRCRSSRELTDNLYVYDFLVDISASQLSKVNNSRDYSVFVMVFYALLCHPSNYREQWRIRRYLGKKILGIDSTQISLKQMLRLPEGVYPLRAKERKGIKIHVAALLGAMVQPLSAIVTPSNVHDSVEFDELLTDVGLFEKLDELILVIDRGYTDYDRYRQLGERGILFVVQLKKNADYEVLSSVEYKNYTEEVIILDGMNLRLLKYKDEREWMFLTNISTGDLSAEDIRDIYRLRWMIEIFFRKLKHVATIKHLYSTTANGVLIQVYSTLIAYTLINMYRITNNICNVSMEKMAMNLKHTFDKPVDLIDPG